MRGASASRTRIKVQTPIYIFLYFAKSQTRGAMPPQCCCARVYDELMLEKHTPGAVRMDLETWERSALFHLFNAFSEPFHGVCLRVDCTESFRFAKQSRISVFLTLVHRALIAAHQVENFMTRIVEGGVWRYATIHGGSAVGRANGTIGFGYYPYRPELLPFVREASAELERVKGRNDLERYAGQDLIRFSVLPWIDFTSISHARDFSAHNSAPLITFGKITEAGDRFTMPVSIHVHHALADGLHVAQFVAQFERYLGAPEAV
jgi:chloramphenicol O-acetyltransferase type A